jgi:hypothetical protein
MRSGYPETGGADEGGGIWCICAVQTSWAARSKKRLALTLLELAKNYGTREGAGTRLNLVTRHKGSGRAGGRVATENNRAATRFQA